MRVPRRRQEPSSTKLHVGAFDAVLDGWLNTDVTPHMLVGRVPGMARALRAAGRLSDERWEAHRAGVFRRLRYLDLTQPLPYPDASFEAAFGQHVLEHLTAAEGEALVRELWRVLRPGGWIATFDYVVRDSRAWKWWLAMDMSPFQPRHAQILRYQQDHEPLWPALERLDYDELLRCFQEVGFTMLNTRVDERRSFAFPPVEKTPARLLDRRPFMGPSYAQAARAVLGEAAESYLSRLAVAPLTLPQTAGGTDVYIFARK
jgi:SAM-dependent methyltransferase